MKRKIIKQAGQAYTVTLPIDWVRSNNLKSGDEIDMIAQEKILTITTDKKTKGGTIKLDLSPYTRKRTFHIMLNSCYAKGIDEVTIITNTKYPDLMANIGYAVVNQKGNQYIIKDISGTSTGNTEDILKRVFQMVIGFFDAAEQDIFGEQKETEDTVRKMDLEINKFCLFLQRVIAKHEADSTINTKVLFCYAFALEKMGDEVLRMWRTAIRHPIKKTKQLKELVVISRQGLEKAFLLQYQSTPENIEKMIELKELARKKSEQLLKTDAGTATFIMHTVNIIEDASDLTHLALIQKLKEE
jgi:phosphate uptake regulator